MVAILLDCYCKNPFRSYPYCHIRFDVSGKRLPELDNYIDDYLSDTENFRKLLKHRHVIEEWHRDCECKLEKIHVFKKKRLAQYHNLCDDEYYHFEMYRRSGSLNCESSHYVSYQWIIDRHNYLKRTKYVTTNNNAKAQRNLMTPDLRKRIMERDNYTCQICGKYMPDRIGLQIDHIIPVSKGWKSDEGNLQVLCSRCNARKGNKIL